MYMTQGKERQIETLDIEKSVRTRRNYKGGRSHDLIISRRPRTQGDVDIEGLLRQIDEQNARKETRHQESRNKARRHRN